MDPENIIQIKLKNMYIHKPQRSKLLNRFNTSLNSQKQVHAHRVTQQMNTSRQQVDEGTERYRNHIKFLQCRIEQQEAIIQKLQLEAENAANVNARLNAQVLKLQRANKNMLDRIYSNENRIRQLQQENNNQMLNQSIQKLQHQLSMSQARKRNRTIQDFENPEKSTKSYRKSVITSQFLSNPSEQPSYRLTSLMNFFKTVPQVYSIAINPTVAKDEDRKIEKSHIQKLELAIYTLKKQQKQEQKKSMETIDKLNKQLKEIKDKNKALSIENQDKEDYISMQKYQKLSNQLKQIEAEASTFDNLLQQKNKQVLLLQQSYQKQIMEAETTLLSLQKNMKQIIQEKDNQMSQIQTDKKQYMQKLKQMEAEYNKLQNNVIEATTKMSDQKQQYEQKIIKLEQKIQELLNQNICNRNAVEQKQLQCLKLNQSLSKKQSQLFEFKQKVNSSAPNQSHLEDLKLKLEKSSSLLQQESKKNNKLLQKMRTLESLNTQISSKQILLSTNLSKANKQLSDLQSEKEEKNKEISVLSSTIRKLEGGVAQKQQLLQILTNQMLQIKQKLMIAKSDVEVQWVDEQGETQAQNSGQPTIEQLQQHFSLILNQKQQQHSEIVRELENQHQVKSQLENQIQKLHSELLKLEDEIQHKNKQIYELNETVARYEEEARERQAEILELRKNVEQLEEKQGYYMDYIDKIKAVDA